MTAADAGLAGIAFGQAAAAALPFPPASFDLVTCTASFHHDEGPLRVLQGWRRILRPGGRFLLLEACTGYLPIWLQVRCRRLFEKGHVRCYHTHDLLALGVAAGFRDVRALWRERGLFLHRKVFTSVVLVEGVNLLA